MEVGTHHYGFRSRFTLHLDRLRTIWVIMDQLIKSAYFLAIHNNFFLDKLVKLYINEIVKFYGIPVSIVSDRDP